MRTVTSQIVHYLSTVADRRTDGELLGGFLNHNAEADFAELVRRHGPMVWGACRRALPDKSDAEDAFQTVFLVLVQRGKRLVGSSCLGPWLHRVAIWTTRNVRRLNARRLARRESLHEQLPISSINVDLSLDLDTALMSLPEKFRSSIVLCHLLGFSRADAAAQLGCAERTLSSWLSRGLAQLRRKLRGLDPVKALSVAGVAVPAALAESAVHAAASLQAAAATASVLSPTISQLVEGVLRMFWVKKATAVSVAMFAMFAFGVGIGVSTHQLAPAASGDEKGAVSQTQVLVEQFADGEFEAKIADLKKQIADTATAARDFDSAFLAQVKNLVDEKDPKAIEKSRSELDLFKQKAASLEMKLAALQKELAMIQEFKSLKALEKAAAQQDKPQPKATQAAKAQPPALAQPELDKKLMSLEEQLRKLHAESEVLQAQNAARLLEMKAQIEVVTATIVALKKEKEKSKGPATFTERVKGGYLELTLDVKLGQGGQLGGPNTPGFPFQVKEVGLDGKIVGSVYFTNSDILGRYLARTIKDAGGPKELRIVSRAETPANLLQTAIELGKAAGFKDVLVAKGGGDTIEAAQAKLAQLQLMEAEKRAKEQLDKNKFLDEKLQKEAYLQKLEQLLKAKEEELRNQKEQKNPQKPIPEQDQEKLLRELEDILKMKQDEFNKLKDLEKVNKSVKPPTPARP
jgi:RNA polymerase sigma factor (sigma-70 family)